MSPPVVFLIGVDDELGATFVDTLKGTRVLPIPLDIDQLLADRDEEPCMIVSAAPKQDLSSAELAQTLRMKYPNAPIFLCCTERTGFERKDFIKNGFTDAFLLPTESVSFKNRLSETLAIATQGQVKVFRPVKIIDVQPGDILDFDTSVYLPANNKYVKLSHAGDSLDETRIDRMKKGKLNSVYVPAEQMRRFYDYSARRLRDLGGDGLSTTEKKEKLTSAVRDLISNLFTEQSASFESGQAVIKDCGEIVKSYILSGADNEWYLRIQQVLGDQGDTYSHAGNVSTLAALFSLGLGIGKPEHLALAGLLHDIGVAELPPEIQALEPEQMTKEQLAEYQKHPDLSVNLIKTRKIVVPEIVLKTISQHHELYNGTGYPRGLFGDRIAKEAQILALANVFEYLTRSRPGQPMLTPAQAVEKLRMEQVNDPSKIHYNPELLKKLLSLFPDPA